MDRLEWRVREGERGERRRIVYTRYFGTQAHKRRVAATRETLDVPAITNEILRRERVGRIGGRERSRRIGHMRDFAAGIEIHQTANRYSPLLLSMLSL